MGVMDSQIGKIAFHKIKHRPTARYEPQINKKALSNKQVALPVVAADFLRTKLVCLHVAFIPAAMVAKSVRVVDPPDRVLEVSGGTRVRN